MPFRDAMLATADVATSYRDGLQALSMADRKRVRCSNPRRRLAGSVNLDAALRAVEPNSARWDYGIGLHQNRGPDRAIWLEVHPASPRNVAEMEAKLQWLKGWLRRSPAPAALTAPDGYFWVASGMVTILKTGPQFRRLAGLGLRFAGRVLNLDRI